ncbi:uncharacterized protein LOC105664794 [Ceratitis capitata]|uniref:Gustatory receptor n=1 Tax=Ceratitis capitata TaxID=7213 RepID=W8CB44_CERCA|nr:uncharacterized protein LOC105664794 [Ceratitis capitata]
MKNRFSKELILTIAILQFVTPIKLSQQYSEGENFSITDRHKIPDDNISYMFYKSAQDANEAKNKLQNVLRNFVEIVQKNLTTSVILKSFYNELHVERSQQKFQKLSDHTEFFKIVSHDLKEFSLKSEIFLQTSKNESNAFLMKLRRIPTRQRTLSSHDKLQLTNYFAEMEFFNIMLFEIIDEGLEYITNALNIIRMIFDKYTDIQQQNLQYQNFIFDNWCYNRYFEFLQKWSIQIYTCATNSRLEAVYNVFAMTEIAIKHIIRQQEFKVQRIFNCFLFPGCNIKCNFLRYAENDFQELFTIVQDLQTYYDIQINRGRVKSRRIERSEEILHLNDLEVIDSTEQCIPYGFPENYMLSNLKLCFNIY